MTTDQDEISRRYRELPREEPPPHLDDAIRAAARRAVGTRPAPLVVPSGRQRWYFPAAAAAIIVLAVAVTMHVERQQPGEEVVDVKSEPAEKPSPAPQSRRERAAESPPPAARDAAPPTQQLRADPGAKAAPPPEVEARSAMGRAETMQRSAPLAKLAERSPEQWLQAIAELRAQSRHDEADKELAEFRKRHPAYQIPEPMLEKVEKR